MQPHEVGEMSFSCARASSAFRTSKDGSENNPISHSAAPWPQSPELGNWNPGSWQAVDCMYEMHDQGEQTCFSVNWMRVGVVFPHRNKHLVGDECKWNEESCITQLLPLTVAGSLLEADNTKAQCPWRMFLSTELPLETAMVWLLWILCRRPHCWAWGVLSSMGQVILINASLVLRAEASSLLQVGRTWTAFFLVACSFWNGLKMHVC